MSRIVKLKDITLNITDGVHGDCEPEDNSGYYFISVKDLEQYCINYDNARQITKEAFINAHKRTKLEIGDTIYANSGHTIGKSLFITENENISKTTFQKSVAILKPNRNYIIPEFLYYLLKNETRGLRAAAVGSAQKNLLLDDIRNYKVKLLDIPEQNKILSILKTIDKKIKINWNINNELEKIAKDLYNYWFVQFDFPDEKGCPYKSNGGKMVYSDELKREIPIGWDIIKLSDIVTKNNTKQERNSQKRLIDLSIMPQDTFCLNFDNNGDTFNTNLFKMNKFDILFGSIRPYLKKAGFAPFDGLITGTIHSVRPIKENLFNYVLLTMTNEFFFNYAISISKGTKMPVAGYDDLFNFKCVYNEDVVLKFANAFNFKSIIANNIQENKSLTQLRDFLLPMLMNTQITVTNSQEDNLSEEKIIKKSLEFWQSHGKMDIDQFARENGTLVYKDNEQKKGAVSYNAEKDLYEIAVKDPRDNFTIAHEIGHILKHKNELKSGTLGRKSEESGIKIMEHEADSLAAEILMPEEYVLQYMQDKNKTDKEFLDENFIKECAKHFNVNPPAINIRLKNLGFKVPYLK